MSTMPQDICNEEAGTERWAVVRWCGGWRSYGHQKRRNFPAFRNLKALTATLTNKVDGWLGGLVVGWLGDWVTGWVRDDCPRKGVGAVRKNCWSDGGRHPVVSCWLDASKARCFCFCYWFCSSSADDAATAASAACPDTCKCGWSNDEMGTTLSAHLPSHHPPPLARTRPSSGPQSFDVAGVVCCWCLPSLLLLLSLR